MKSEDLPEAQFSSHDYITHLSQDFVTERIKQFFVRYQFHETDQSVSCEMKDCILLKKCWRASSVSKQGLQVKSDMNNKNNNNNKN